MKVRFTSVGDEFSQPSFFTSQSLHPRVVFLIFSVCVPIQNPFHLVFYMDYMSMSTEVDLVGVQSPSKINLLCKLARFYLLTFQML
jgi:hypothetical protein